MRSRFQHGEARSGRQGVGFQCFHMGSRRMYSTGLHSTHLPPLAESPHVMTLPWLSTPASLRSSQRAISARTRPCSFTRRPLVTARLTSAEAPALGDATAAGGRRPQGGSGGQVPQLDSGGGCGMSCRLPATGGGVGEGKERLRPDMATYKWPPRDRWSMSASLTTSTHHEAKTLMQNQGRGLSEWFCKVEVGKYPVL